MSKISSNKQNPERSPLSIDVPEPKSRSGDDADFSHIALSAAGEVRRPAVDVDGADIRDLANSLVRVLDDAGNACGEWAPDLPAETLLRGLRAMEKTRAFDKRMLMAQRQGKTSFYMQCTGEEAVACGQQLVLNKGDMSFPTYRQQGLLIAQDIPLTRLMNQIFNNAEDPLEGRQLPILYSEKDYGHFSMSGNVATQIIHAVGWAMGSAMMGDTKIAVGWIGDGSTAEGDFYAALLFASVYRAPVILNIVNNQWAISSFSGIAGGGGAAFAVRGHGFGIPSIRVDGNDFLAVYAVSAWAAERARRNLGPTLIEWVTYRVAAHSTSDDPKQYRSETEAEMWPLGDPIARLKQHLCSQDAWSEQAHRQMQAELEEEVRDAFKAAEKNGTLHDNLQLHAKAMFEHVYAEPPERLLRQQKGKRVLIMAQMTMIEAIRDALDVKLQEDPTVAIFGEDVGYFGGVFRCTQDLQEKFGKTRVFDAPINELGIIGVAIGMAAYGVRPVPEIQFADYILPAYDQLVSEAARLRYRSGGQFSCPITVRTPCGGGIFGGQTHSQSPEAIFAHVSGLKTVMPSTPHDAKGMLIAAIENEDPVIFLEPKRLYNGPFDGHYDRPITPWKNHPGSETPEGNYNVPLGKAAIRREGQEVTVLAYGTMVHVAEAAINETGIDAELIDLRSLLPMDEGAIANSVRKTGRCVVVHEATRTCGYGAELVTTVQELCFYHLEAPIIRVTGYDTPYPHAQEWLYFPSPERIGDALKSVMMN